ncbi:hypothetical protein QY95_01163 [Bacillus thermotolerans]|uniref:Uncharacterized protein n=1 Tax=Bacillus thermotolerans TaxID=1221996 RepID=A0A0F5I5N8_BACTR|nr:hypothetical protein QY95_01163 [Bacillus thermotolerans]
MYQFFRLAFLSVKDDLIINKEEGVPPGMRQVIFHHLFMRDEGTNLTVKYRLFLWITD